MTTKPALGKGLGSLIPQKKSLTSEIIPEAKGEVSEVLLGRIQTNSRQPRQFFSASKMEDLISSVKEHGILMPLVVTKSGNGFELIAGERRLRAAKMLDLKKVPVIIRDVTDQEKLELALIENIQRQDLNALEEAIAYRALTDEFNLTQEDVATRVGKSRSAVANTMRLLDLPAKIQIALREGKISKSHGRTLLSEKDPEKQIALFSKMLQGDMTVRAAEGRVVSKQKTIRTKFIDPNISAHEKKLREILGTKVTIQNKKGKGHILIEYYSEEEFLDLLDRLIS